MPAPDTTSLFPWITSEHSVASSIVAGLSGSLLPSDRCYRRVGDDEAPLAAWRRAILAAASEFAAQSQPDGERTYAQVVAHATDIVALRTGGGCPTTLPPDAESAAGFLRGLFLVGPEPQRLTLWRPHSASVPTDHQNGTLLLRPGKLWLHHSTLPYHAAGAGAGISTPDSGAPPAVWLRCLLWYVPAAAAASSMPKATKKKKGGVGMRRTLWHTPLASERDARLVALAESLARHLGSRLPPASASARGTASRTATPEAPGTPAPRCWPPATRQMLAHVSAVSSDLLTSTDHLLTSSERLSTPLAAAAAATLSAADGATLSSEALRVAQPLLASVAQPASSASASDKASGRLSDVILWTLPAVRDAARAPPAHTALPMHPPPRSRICVTSAVLERHWGADERRACCRLPSWQGAPLPPRPRSAGLLRILFILDASADDRLRLQVWRRSARTLGSSRRQQLRPTS